MSITEAPDEPFIAVEPDVLELSAIMPARAKARLRTLANPEGLRPDGSEYELVTPEELSLIELRRLGADWQRTRDLQAPEKATKRDLEDAERILNDLVTRLIDGAVVEDVAQLPVMTRESVAIRFFVSLNDRQLAALGPETMAALARVRAV